MGKTLLAPMFHLCREVLLECGQFDNIGSLRTIFRGVYLGAYKDGLPEGNSNKERVDNLMDYLFEQYLGDGTSVFALFLQALRDEYKESHPLHKKISSLIDNLGLGDSGAISVPVMIMAMNRQEADDLNSGKVFNDPSVSPAKREQFRNFKEILQSQFGTTWIECYGENRLEWKPLAEENKTIKEIIASASHHINFGNDPSASPALVEPNFELSNNFLTPSPEMLRSWRQLAKTGCILIIDAISLYHPVLKENLKESGLSSNENVAVLVVSPVNSFSVPINKMIEEEVREMKMTYLRFNDDLDHLCDFGVSDFRFLRRWLSAILPETAIIIRDGKFRSSNRHHIRDEMGQPRGMVKLISGEGTAQ
jgi:hypothetical protein